MADQITGDSAPFEQLRSQFLAEFQSDPVLAKFGDRVDDLCEPLWNWAQTIDEADPAFRLRQQGAAQLLEVIGPDRPFLVDSLLGACSAFGLTVEALFHPIVQMPSGQHRSLIQIHLPGLSETEGESLLREVEQTLHDVDLATGDYSALLEKMANGIAELRSNDRIDRGLRDEAVDFLSWLSREHFVFLGARDYTFLTDETGAVVPAEPEMVEGSNLGILRDEERNVLNPGAEPLLLTDEISRFLSEPEPIILAKATLLSRVHRRVPADYVGIKHFDSYGRVTGETRFLGLYTSEAYNQSVTAIPLLRQRRLDVLRLANALPGSHTEKAITNVLEGWPRDELFQTDADDLAPIILGAANLNGRPRVRLFARQDQFQRFVSVITFVPKDAYDSALRVQIGEELEAAFGGELVQFEPKFVGSDLVRVLFEISLPDNPPSPDLAALEQRLVEISTTWRSRFRTAMMSPSVDRSIGASAPQFVDAFTAGYREAFSPHSGVLDVEILLNLPADRPITLRAYRDADDPPHAIKAKIYSASGPIALSDCVPIFERMGLFVVFESGYPITPSEKAVPHAPDTYWVHALSLRRLDQAEIDLDSVQAPFEAAFVAVWSGEAENDGFNGLVLNAGLDWREAALCRTLCAYRQQTGMDPARETQIEALKEYPDITLKLIGLFATRFDPGFGRDLFDRAQAASAIRQQIDDALRQVVSLSHDRVLRRLADLIEAIKRTNFYQRDQNGDALAHISFKIATVELEDVPEPKPAREIFLASPDVEGVHCRFGAVARGGLRWSDRRDDFRTEVLGLVKAQQVKNSVIVPVGSKGGFFVKTATERDDREARQNAGVAAYKTFIAGLLGLTDNLHNGAVVQPSNTVTWDGEDPYLVVAADKGTATFSDIANGISNELGFWLGDAFASGGSAGYDHKAMGITARGAWEAVKRHFREREKDIQEVPFTVVGVGDMSGDVFGNGMLLSKQIKLIAAFNHRHIFVDPDPADPGATWAERKRLFDLPRSGWDDYDQSLISKGGGVFDRSAKSIELTPELKTLIGSEADTLTPDELIHLLLKTKVELLWFGGIGTYVKATLETDADADDRGNDAIRVNASEVGADVIGEGANLGMTQAARIEFALQGGAVNTDAIDNSAGVDSSDHEVNIKILLSEAIRNGSLQEADRNALLADMTETVATHVLRHNYDQTLALSLAHSRAVQDHEAYERLMLVLEERGALNREVEGLPDTTEMQARKEQDQTLTRPEISVLLAWSKIVLFDDLLETDLPDDPFFKDTLTSYFPAALHTMDDAMAAHRLKREIIATVLSNRTLDLGGPALFRRRCEDKNVSGTTMVAALELARILTDGEAIEAQINALDNKVPGGTQVQLRNRLAKGVGAVAEALLDSGPLLPISDVLQRYQAPFRELSETFKASLSPPNRAQFDTDVADITDAGAPSKLAEALAGIRSFRRFPHLVQVAEETGTGLPETFATFQRLGLALGTTQLNHLADTIMKELDTWARLATRRLQQDVKTQQFAATRLALAQGNTDVWLSDHADALAATRQQIDTYTGRHPGFAQLSLAADAVRKFMSELPA